MRLDPRAWKDPKRHKDWIQILWLVGGQRAKSFRQYEGALTSDWLAQWDALLCRNLKGVEHGAPPVKPKLEVL